jgi:hypothetical protein
MSVLYIGFSETKIQGICTSPFGKKERKDILSRYLKY